jgi:hypothetical protein
MRRHETDWTSLIAGVTFCAIAIAYLAGEVTHRSLELRWVLPMLLIGLGIAGLAGTLVRARRLSDAGSPGAAAPASAPASTPATAPATAPAATPATTPLTDTADRSDDEPHPSSP